MLPNELLLQREGINVKRHYHMAKLVTSEQYLDAVGNDSLILNWLRWKKLRRLHESGLPTAS